MLKRIYISEHIPGVGVYLLRIFFQVTEQMRVGWGETKALEKHKFIWTLVPKVEGLGFKPHKAIYSEYIQFLKLYIINKM